MVGTKAPRELVDDALSLIDNGRKEGHEWEEREAAIDRADDDGVRSDSVARQDRPRVATVRRWACAHAGRAQRSGDVCLREPPAPSGHSSPRLLRQPWRARRQACQTRLPFEPQRTYRVAIYHHLLTGLNVIEPLMSYVTANVEVPDLEACRPVKDLVLEVRRKPRQPSARTLPRLLHPFLHPARSRSRPV